MPETSAEQQGTRPPNQPGQSDNTNGANMELGCTRSPSLSARSGQPYETTKTTKTTWLIAAAASLALHGGIVAATQTTPDRIEKARQTISFFMQKVGHEISTALNALTQSPDEQKAKKEQINTWENALKEDPNLPGFDYGDFFLKLSWLEGYITEEELKKDKQKLNQHTKHYKNSKKQPHEGPFSIIKKMMEEQFGEYTQWSAQLHRLLDEKEGNCDARVQMMISLIQGVFNMQSSTNPIPMKVRVSRQKLKDGKEQLHVDLLIKIENKWYIAAPELPESKIEDLEGTAIFEVSDYVRTYLGEENTESNTVKPEKTPNENDLDNPETNSLANLANNVDPKKLKTHEQKPQSETFAEKQRREPIEMEVIFRDSPTSAAQTSSTPPPAKDQPDTASKLPKRQLTNQEVVDAALNKKIRLSPDIENLEPLRGIHLNKVIIDTGISKGDDVEWMSEGEWPSFEPLAETPPKEIMISVVNYASETSKPEEVESKNRLIPDLSPLYGKTAIRMLNIATSNLNGWKEILRNFDIQDAVIGIISDNDISLKPLTGAKIAESLQLSIATRGAIDFTGIDSMAVAPQELHTIVHAEQRGPSPNALRGVHFATFETSNYTLDEGVLDGAVIQTDIVKLNTAPWTRDPKKIKHLRDIFKTRRVIIIDEETAYSDTALEAVRSMSPLDSLTVEMEAHTDKDYFNQYKHMTFSERRSGKKPELDITPLKEASIANASFCGGYQFVDMAGSRIMVTPESPIETDAIEIWRKHFKNLP